MPCFPFVSRASAQNASGRSAQIAVPPSPPKFGGLSWSAPAGSEPGWGIAIDHQGDVVVAVWATYDADGSPVWFVVPRAEPPGGVGVFNYTIGGVSGSKSITRQVCADGEVPVCIGPG